MNCIPKLDTIFGGAIQQDGPFFDNPYNLNNRIILILDFLLYRFYDSTLYSTFIIMFLQHRHSVRKV